MARKTKRASKDFERAMLPQTRKAVFFDVVKLQWRKLLLLALILLIFALPLFLIALYEDSYFYAVTEDPSFSPHEMPAILAPLNTYCAVFSAPALALLFLGLSGVVRVQRQLAWGENVTVFHDFSVGFRQNWKQIFPVGLLFGIFFALAKIGWYSAIVSQADSVWIQGILMGLLAFLVAPVTAYCIVVIAIYTNSFWGNLKIALYIYLKNPLKAFGAMLLNFGLCLVVWMIPSTQLHLTGTIPAIMVFTLGLLGWMLFSFNQLDRHYNKTQYPELVGKGVNGHF